MLCYSSITEINILDTVVNEIYLNIAATTLSA